MGKTASFTIGKVTGVHGLGGNLKVWSFAESIETFRPGRIVLLKFENEEGTAYTITRATPHKKGILMNLEGVDNRNLAEALVGKEIVIERDQLPEPEEDTWYWQDLIGLEVIDERLGKIGTITEIFPTNANDILVVKQGETETLVPMHRQFVRSVDLDTDTVCVDLPEEEDQ